MVENVTNSAHVTYSKLVSLWTVRFYIFDHILSRLWLLTGSGIEKFLCSYIPLDRVLQALILVGRVLPLEM